MAAALHPVRNDPTKNPHYTRALMNEFDFDDNRYPTVSSRSPTNRFQPSYPPDHARAPSTPDMLYPSSSDADMQAARAAGDSTRLSLAWATADQRDQPDAHWPQRSSSRQDGRSQDPLSPDQQSQDPPRTSLSYALPPGAARRVVERYSLDDNTTQSQSRASNDTRVQGADSVQETVVGPRSRQDTIQASRALSPGAEDPISTKQPPTSSLRKASSPQPSPAGVNSAGTSQFPPIMSLSASPAYNPPISPNLRAYAQHPIYVNQNNAPNPPGQPVYTPIIPQEEVCVECAMRDQDMADVDVTTPGVWDRASDVLFEELKQRELEEEANGVVVDIPSRPRAKGGRLTEQNLKLWLSINPREPASRQQTLNSYIKSQRTLLEAEALAHARAMQEAKQLDNRMRDAYSQLRRSAYDNGNSFSPSDDMGGVRIKPPQSPNTPTYNHTHARSNSREVTLLENGMIVEHVDVRKEEKEARERKKREEKRARKSSRGSMMDVTSIISAQSGPMGESSLKPYSRYSQASAARPTSVLTAPLDRPDLPRAYSQASFSDVHSMGSASPRRTRFFGMKNLSTGWKSQESFAPSGMSGSMVDMHVALQRENNGAASRRYTTSPIDLNTTRRSQIIWPQGEDEPSEKGEEKTKKKKGGLAKIWRVITGKNEDHNRDSTRRLEGNEDDLPLAPPPPLSYLVNRGPGEGGMRHASTPSLPSIVSPKFGSPGMSPPTAPSSLLPSPASLRRSGDIEIADGRNANSDADAQDDTIIVQPRQKSLHSAKSDNQLRPQSQSIPSLPSSPMPTSKSNSLSPNVANGSARPTSLSREKSLPPIPPGEQPARILPSDLRPRTYYDHRTLPPGSGPAHDFLPPQAPFRTPDARRQSFGGTSSKPNLTMPTSRPVAFDSPRSFGPRYDEFGASRQSLGRLDLLANPQAASTKRKSKFGFASLLGKKSDKREAEPMQEKGVHFPSMNYSPYDMQDDSTTNGYTNSVSRHSTFSSNAPNPNTRMSVTSRKALEELVQQDAEFVAYRYPSNDQQLDLLR
ncbi:hypothetical protein BDN70DRAFT_885073 [Pholiota conissans]|uniref:Proteophosphoglycan ppg4 n=1 Tax=Pholiota conissans TaxID=109636 RepID=A0A9P6CW57_9AGAR|nr:hypothetical protein BDN70DRAFT_885073 [Pholiota conissans]